MKNARTAISDAAEKPRRAVRADRAAILAGVVAFAALTAWGARISVPLPGTPIPGTLQLLPVLMAGLFLGPGGGCSSQALYVAIGLGGLPVFALPGAGPAYLLGPTGGYLLGFVVAPWVVGRLAGRDAGGPWRRLAALVAGLLVVHACGFAGLLPHVAGSAPAALRAGILPFALFDLAKIAAALALHSGWLALERRIASGWRTGSRS